MFKFHNDPKVNESGIIVLHRFECMQKKEEKEKREIKKRRDVS